VFQAGLALFVLASGGCALAHTLPELAFARAVQGLGAAGVMSVNGALVRYTYPHRQLGRGIGLNALVISVAAVLGPSIASAVLAVGPWQWLFAVNLPVGVAALLVAWFALPDSARTGRGLDGVSAVLNVLAFGLIIVGVDVLTRGAAAWIGALELAAGALAAAILIHRSFSQSRPMVPIDLLRGRLFRLSVLTSIASFAAQMLAFVALPFFFQDVLSLALAAVFAAGGAGVSASRLLERSPHSPGDAPR
jgi:DHA2 family multidrug resistance protein-like MFS transporter